MTITPGTSIALATLSLSGVTDGDGQIVIDTTSILPTTMGTSAVLLVTYDSALRVIASEATMTQVSFLTQFETTPPQSAMLFVNTAASGATLTLRLPSSPSAPVPWRAVGLLMDGRIRDADQLRLSWGVGPRNLPVVVGEDATIALFGSEGAETTFTPLDLQAVEVTAADVDQVGRIIACSWVGTAAQVVATGGPWFSTAFGLDWNYTYVAPPLAPPTGADDYWAAPAACDSADVFLINDDSLAARWDQAGTAEQAMASPTTLLLNHIGADGTKWMLTGLEGWWNLPPVALPDLAMPGSLNGAFPVDGRYEPRIITMQGVFWPGPGVSVSVPRLRLLRALDAVRGGALLVVKEPVWPKQAMVWLGDQPKVDVKDGTGWTEFDVQLKAVDPIKYHGGLEGLRIVEVPVTQGGLGRRYEPPQPEMRYDEIPLAGEVGPNGYSPWRRYQKDFVGESATCTNSGTIAVHPRIHIFGPAQDPMVANSATGQTMRFRGSIVAGQVLVVDCYWRTVVLRDAAALVIETGFADDYKGVNRRSMLSLFSPWMNLPQGDNEIMATAWNGSEATECIVSFRSGWIGS